MAYFLNILNIAFLVSASLFSGCRSKGNPLGTKYIETFARRNCLEQLDVNGQPLFGEDGAPQFTCDFYMPTMQQIEARIGSTGLLNDPKKIPAYYTGWSQNEVEGELAGYISIWISAYLARDPRPALQVNADGYYWWWNAVPEDWWYAQRQWILNNQDDSPNSRFPPGSATVFDACISEVLASMNIGREIFLFVPTEYVLGSEPNRHWWSIEYPILTNNPLVETIYRIDPRPCADGRICGERVIWVNSFRPQRQTWKCADNAHPLPPSPAQPPTHSPPRSIAERSPIPAHLNSLSRRQCWAEEDVMTGIWEYDAEQCDDYLPDLAQCQAHLKQQDLIDDSSNIPVYYTGWKNPIAMKDITDWIAAYMVKYISLQKDPKPKGWYWYWTALDTSWYNVQENYIVNNVVNLKNLDSSIVTAEVAKEVLVVCMCEAFAVSCVGSTVLLMVPNDYVLGEEQGRHWWNIEFAVLTKNPSVQKIYRVDPRPLEDPGKECEDLGKLKPELIWERGRDPEAPQILSCKQFVTDPPPPPTQAEPVTALSPPPLPVDLPEQSMPRSTENSPNTIHFSELSRRECVGTSDVLTGDIQYLPENCDNLAPTLAQCIDHFNGKFDDGVVAITDPTKIPIYYTGWPQSLNSADLFQWINAFVMTYVSVLKNPKETGWYWFWNTWDKDWYDVQEEYLMENTEKIENIKPAGKEQDIAAILDGCMNEAFASSCIYPKVFLMVPQDYVLGSEKHRHWWAIEFGALTRNPNVQEIFRLDPRPHETDDECTGYAPVLIWSREGDDEADRHFYCDYFVNDTPLDSAPPPPPPPPNLQPAEDPPAVLLRRVEKPWTHPLPVEVDEHYVNGPSQEKSHNGPNSSPDAFELAGAEGNLYDTITIPDQPLQTSAVTDMQPSTSHLLRADEETGKEKVWSSTSAMELDRRQCTERNPDKFDTRWDCDEYLPTLQQIVARIQSNGITIQEDMYAVYFTGFENNDVVIGRLKGWIAAWMKWYIQCVLETHRLEGTTGTRYWYWYFDVVSDLDEDWFRIQDDWIEEHSPPNAYDADDTYFPEEAPKWFGQCTSQAYATACEQSTVILFAPHDYVLADHPNRHFYGAEFGALTRNAKVQTIIRADPTPPEDPKQPHSQPTTIWDRSNPAMNARMPQYFNCEDILLGPPPNPSSESNDDDDDDDPTQFDMDLGAG